MWTRALLTLIIAGCTLTLRGDQGSASVFDCGSGRAISGAAVLLSREDGTALEAETDSEGYATFLGLRPGAYRFRAEKPGYVDLLDPHGRGRLAVVSPANQDPVGIGLTRTAVISGQVLDLQGTPLQGAKVLAIVRRRVLGDSRFTAFGEAARTDDGGRYRLHGLPPGHYSVVVVPIGEAEGAEVFAPVYFPRSVDPGQAVFFELRPGETRTSADLTLTGVETLSVSGTVSGIPKDWNGKRAAVSLATQGGLRAPTATALTEADGAFVIRNVPAGEYQLTAWGPITGSDSEGPMAGANARSAVRAVRVSGGADVQIDLELRPLVTVNGRFNWDGKPRSDFACKGAATIALRSEDGWLDVWSPVVSVTGDRFTVQGLPAGRYRVELPDLEDSCRLAAVRVGNEATPDGIALVDGSAPLTLDIGSATGEISGVVTRPEAKPAVGNVVLVPADREGAVQIAQFDAEGGYRFSRVPAGAYRLMAMKELNSMDYLDPLAAPNLDARTVLVEAGRKATADLRLVQ